MAERYLKCYGFVVAALLSLSCSEAPSDSLESDRLIISTHTDAAQQRHAVSFTVTPGRLAATPNSTQDVDTALPAKSDQPDLQNRAVKLADVYFSSAMNLRPTGQDQSAQLNQVLGSLPPGATFIFDTGPEFIIGSPLLLTKPITIDGRNVQFSYSGSAGTSIINLQSAGIVLKDLKVLAPYERYNAKSFIIGTSANSNSNPFGDISITGCTFTGYSGVAINLRYVTRFNISNNEISKMPYAGIACYSVSNGTIEGNSISNMTAEGTAGANAYGVTVQQLGQDSVSRGVRIANNKIRSVPWEGIDTHGSEYLYIYGNDMRDCAVGMAMVSTRYKSPQNIVLANNRIEYRGNTKSAIRFDGRMNAKNASGIIVNNELVGQHIRLENTSNLMIFANEVNESETGYGIYLSGQNDHTYICNNAIQDVWSKANGNSYAIYFDNDSNTAVLDGNRLLSKGFKSSNNTNNKFGFKINEKSRFCQAEIGDNDFSSAKGKDYVRDGNMKELLKGKGKSRKADYSDVDDRSVSILSDMSAQAKLILPELTKANDGLAFVLTNPSKKAVAANVLMTSMKDPAQASRSLPGSSTTIFYYDFFSGRIWIM